MILDANLSMSDALYVNGVVFAHVYSADDGTDTPTPRAIAAADQFMANKPVLFLFQVQTWNGSDAGQIALMHKPDHVAHLLGCIEMWLEDIPQGQVAAVLRKKD